MITPSGRGLGTGAAPSRRGAIAGIIVQRVVPACRLAALVATIGLVAGCQESQPAGPNPVGSGSPASLDAAYQFARRQPNLTSLVVARSGAITRQEYFNGGAPDAAQDVRSVTKSVVSLLIGIALDRGCLRSVDQSIGELLGPIGPGEGPMAAVTVRHLLTMSSGIGGDELADPGVYNPWAAAPNQLEYLWRQPIIAPPGARFAYYSPAYHVLSAVLTRACGVATADFARDSLLGPLGAGTRLWETDDQGLANGAAGLSLTPMDMLALGGLVLADGRAAAQQVVSAQWVQESTRTHMATGAQRYSSGYGYGWWTGSTSALDFVLASGWGGQFVVVVPRLGLVVTAAARWQGLGTTAAQSQWMAIADIIFQRVVPACRLAALVNRQMFVHNASERRAVAS